MLAPNKVQIGELLDKREYHEAFTLFYEILESLSYHFIKDERYCHFDDMYSPEYAVNDMLRVFHGLVADGKLPEDVKVYLHKAWKEIEDTECYKDYGMPRKDFETI